MDQEIINKVVATFGANRFFTPCERKFINDPLPGQIERIQFSWRYECLWVMLWSIGYVESLGRPDALCDVSRAVGILRDKGPDQFVDDAHRRPVGEILDETDLIYRYHWAVVDARLKNACVPGIDAGVVKERHYALNWITGYLDQRWDEISTDT